MPHVQSKHNNKYAYSWGRKKKSWKQSYKEINTFATNSNLFTTKKNDGEEKEVATKKWW